MARASRSKRSENFSCATLMATSRLSRVSRALYTSPMPPAPIGARISQGPSLSPTSRDMRFDQFYRSQVQSSGGALERTDADPILSGVFDHAGFSHSGG